MPQFLVTATVQIAVTADVPLEAEARGERIIENLLGEYLVEANVDTVELEE